MLHEHDRADMDTRHRQSANSTENTRLCFLTCPSQHTFMIGP